MSISLQRGLNRRAHREVTEQIDGANWFVPDGLDSRQRRKCIEKHLRKVYGESLLEIFNIRSWVFAISLLPVRDMKGSFGLVLETRDSRTMESNIGEVMTFTDHAMARIRQAGLDPRDIAVFVGNLVFEKKSPGRRIPRAPDHSGWVSGHYLRPGADRDDVRALVSHGAGEGPSDAGGGT
jgi:hypothetical protein